ncbi:POK18 protein, partial [Podilymbus podiceps]|nr:POK18 protein [Podilymbus podiceps]
LQKLLETLNGVRPLLGLTTQELHPLFQLLKGDPDLTLPRRLTPEAQKALEKVSDALSNRQASRRIENIKIGLYVMLSKFQPYGFLAQWEPKQQDPLIIL